MFLDFEDCHVVLGFDLLNGLVRETEPPRLIIIGQPPVPVGKEEEHVRMDQNALFVLRFFCFICSEAAVPRLGSASRLDIKQ